MNGRLKQAVVGLVVVSSVSVVGGSVTLSQFQGAARIRRAVKTDEKVSLAATPTVVRTASEKAAEKASRTEFANAANLAAESLTRMESELLSRSARSHRVQLINGSISGAIQLLDASGAIRNLTDVKVSFYQHGSLVTQAAAGPDGLFTATMGPGVYTLVAYSPSGYCAYGVQAVDPAAEIRSAGFISSDIQSTLQIESLAIPSTDFEVTYNLARRYAGRTIAGPMPTRAADATDSLPEMPVDGAQPQTSLRHYTVHLQPDGSLLGKLTRLNPSTGDLVRIHALNAFLVKNGVVTTQAGVAEDGAFKFSSVSPGVYSFVTAGSEGFSAFSVVIAPPVGTAAVDNVLPVSFQAGDSVLTATPGAPSDIGPATDPLGRGPNDEGPPPFVGDVPPGGAGGGGFGGGGSGGGFGGGGAGGGGLGIGGLLGIAGIGLGAAALLDDDDNNGPVSPAAP